MSYILDICAQNCSILYGMKFNPHESRRSLIEKLAMQLMKPFIWSRFQKFVDNQFASLNLHLETCFESAGVPDYLHQQWKI